jgi:hypothetical protein
MRTARLGHSAGIVALTLSVALSAMLPQAAHAAGRACGSDRKPIKTRFVSGAPDQTFTVHEFLTLGKPARGKKVSFYRDRLIEGGQEGRVVSLRGFLHGAALSRDDSDYHIQLSGVEGDCSNVVVVEVPDDHCVDDSRLAKPALRVRRAIDKILGKQPTKTYRSAAAPVEVVVTGQLFYDIHHERHTDPGGGRGKPRGKCKAGGLWEIHPIMKIEVVPS